MTDKRSKYDTDPLDAEFARSRTGAGGETGEVGGATRDVGRTSAEMNRASDLADAPTRLFEPASQPGAGGGRGFDPGAPYPSVFASETAHAAGAFRTAGESQLGTAANAGGGSYQARGTEPLGGGAGAAGKTSARVVPGVGLPENLLVVASYAPFFLGAVAAIMELALVPRGEQRVRFHAAQGLALHAIIIACAMLLRFARQLALFTFGGFASGFVSLVWTAFFVVSTVYLVRKMLRVWNGEPERVETIANLTRFFDEQIAPRS